jgi:hypothetical protein
MILTAHCLECNFCNTSVLHTYLPTKMEQTECSETLAFKLQTLLNHPEESIQHSQDVRKRNTACLFCPEDGSGILLRNVGAHVRLHITEGSTTRSSLFCRNISQFLRLSGKFLFIIYKIDRPYCSVVTVVKNSFSRKRRGLRDRGSFCEFVLSHLNV